MSKIQRVADPSEIEAALSFIDPSEREVWVRMGMAVKAELGEFGFDLWDAWSQGAGNYNARACKSSWKSFKDRGAVGIGSLFHEAKLAGWEPQREARQLTEAEIAERKARHEKAEQERLDEQARVALKAKRIWDGLPESGSSEYLNRKRVRAFGLKFSKGTIVVPVRDVHGNLWGLQFIAPNGTKTFLTGMAKSGHFHAIEGNEILAVAEGYATAASIHQACGWTVLVAFDAGNLPVVARAARSRWPERRMVICGDDDSETPGNPGRAKALAAAKECNAYAVFPSFDMAA